jgi:hypothetical protein
MAAGLYPYILPARAGHPYGTNREFPVG